ncbi:MAG: ORF6N domain-containing protein [Bacteroidales bacterium]|nr:ORF6N domain-containing protein [Bacteroidales bacterium]
MNKKEAVNEVKELLNPNGEEICIKQKIYEIRNCQVMIDKDLAFLYGVETKVLNQAVKRNIERFPSDFHFQLTMEECLRSQIVTLNEERGKHLKYLPYAFTENCIAMLSSVLRSPAAIEMNIRIMRIFTSMRRLFANDILFNHRLSNLEFHQVEIDKRLDYISKKIENNNLPQEGIFFDGQIFNAYCFVSDLIRSAIGSIILIDNYIDDTVLTLLDKCNKNVMVTIYTQKITEQLKLDIKRHNEQYNAIDVKCFNKSHDRFLIIDNCVYHIGTSIKDLGKKWFAITLMKSINSDDILEKLI